MVATTTLGAVARVLLEDADRQSTATPTFDHALTGVAAATLVGCCGWAWCAITAVVWEALGRAPRPVPGVPRGLRRLVLLGCGVVVTASLAHPAYADGGGHRRPSVVGRLDGLPLPDLVATPPRHPGRAAAGRTLLVRPGDSLWSIAQHELGPGSTDAELARDTRRLYAANRSRIGPDPDLIHPGLRLRLPVQESS